METTHSGGHSNRTIIASANDYAIKECDFERAHVKGSKLFLVCKPITSYEEACHAARCFADRFLKTFTLSELLAKRANAGYIIYVASFNINI